MEVEKATPAEVETEKTVQVIRCNSWMELKHYVRHFGPFISYSSGESKPWSAEQILANMEVIRHGGTLRLMTRANGLRAKVAELIMANNYGDPWE